MDGLFPFVPDAPAIDPARELIIDSFAGGGGASTGIEMALGRSPDIAINHDGAALAVHALNHSETLHLSKNVWQVDPLEAVRNRPVGLAWFSPDCKHHSKAKGGRPVKRSIRDLAWVVVLWARRARPRVIILENVEEFADWGPLVERAAGAFFPDPERRGQTFQQWRGELERLGYKVEWRELRACDYGAPTIRKRLFLIARRDGKPIVWPEPTHGDPKSKDAAIRAAVAEGRLRPWRTAAEIIDWSLPCPSIFDTSEEIKAKFGIRANRPLAEATMARIAKGVQRYVLEAVEPFIVPVTHPRDARVHGVDEPLRTVTGAHRGELAYVAPVVTYAQQGGAVRPADAPLHTICASPKDQNAVLTPFVTKFRANSIGHPADEPLHTVTANSYLKRPGGAAPLALAVPYLVPRYGERDGQEPRTMPADAPVGTIVPTGNEGSVAAALLVKNNFGDKPECRADEPLRTICTGGNHMAVAAFLAQHNAGPREGIRGRPAEEPVSTLTTSGSQQGVIAAHMLNMRGSDRRDAPADEPLRTESAGGTHAATVAAFLAKYYGEGLPSQGADEPVHTVTTKPRHGLVTVTIAGEPYVVVDIGMRMLTVRERFAAQGFPPDFLIDVTVDGKPISAEVQGRLVGNSVCPPLARALVAANCADMAVGPSRFAEAAE